MYLHQLASGRERRPIDDAFRASPYYLNTSRYAWQLDHYLEHIPIERVKVLTTDALRDDQATTLAELYEFIGVDPDAAPRGEVRRGRTEDKRVATTLKTSVVTTAGLPRRSSGSAPGPATEGPAQRHDPSGRRRRWPTLPADPRGRAR